MKHFLFSFVVLVTLLSGCQQKSAAPEVYTPQKTEPMELVRFETIQLQKPDTESGDALMKVIQNRKTTREFESTNLSLKHLSELLWVAYGINREDGKRTVPSAMALYPLDVYVALANGVYLYNPQKHELEPVIEGDHRALTGMQPFVQTAPVNLVFIANYSRYQGDRPIPQEAWVRMASLDAGHCTQDVYLYCASEGLKSVVRGMAQEQELLSLLKLGENHQFIVAQTVGY